MLTDVNSCEKSNDINEIRQRAAILQQAYPEDLEECFPDEFLQYFQYAKGKAEVMKNPIEALNELITTHLSMAFPNVCVALRIYVTIMSSNAEGERLFFFLKACKKTI